MMQGGLCSPCSPPPSVAADGVLVKTMGDGCLASFGSAADAVTAAVDVQQACFRLRTRTVPGLGLRVGLAVGDVTEEDDDVFGPAVVIAERLCSAADEQQVLVTDMVRALTGDRGGHAFEAVGDLVLKGFPDPVSAYRIRFELAAGERASAAGCAGGDPRGTRGRQRRRARPAERRARGGECWAATSRARRG